jgi:hypothetical protein
MYGCTNIILAIVLLHFCYISYKKCNKCKNKDDINYTHFLTFILLFNIIFELILLFAIKNHNEVYRFLFNVSSLFLIIVYLLTPILIIKYITDVKENCNCVKLDKLYNIALLIGYIKIIISIIHILCLGNILLSVNRSGLIKLKIISK